METLSKVNEQKDNVLAPNTTLSPSGTLARRTVKRVGCQDSDLYEMNACVVGSKHAPVVLFLCLFPLHLRHLTDGLVLT